MSGKIDYTWLKETVSKACNAVALRDVDGFLDNRPFAIHDLLKVAPDLVNKMEELTDTLQELVVASELLQRDHKYSLEYWDEAHEDEESLGESKELNKSVKKTIGKARNLLNSIEIKKPPFEKHPSNVFGWGSSIEQLAKEVGRLKYNKVATFLSTLSKELTAQSIGDTEKGRVKLSSTLIYAAQYIHEAAVKMNRVWEICAPHMQSDTDINLPQRNSYGKETTNKEKGKEVNS